MFVKLAFFTAALFTANLAAAEPFAGTWTGDVTEKGQESTYPVEMEIFERSGRVFHNTRYGAPLECRGGGVAMERSTGALHLVELIVRNRYDCADGTIRLYLNGKDKLIWEWFTPSGEYVARADLNRRE